MSFSKVAIAVASVLSVTSGAPSYRFSRHHELDNYSFDDYVRESGKKYQDKEYDMRKNLFLSNLKIIKQHNSENNTWKMGVNQFTDLTKEELQATFGGHKASLHLNKKTPTSVVAKSSSPTLPAQVDWRSIPNVVSPVKDQGKCGSCWAFAATATIESHVAINTGILNELSQQELVSCMANSDDCGGTGGCQGATAELAFDYLSTYGLAESFSYGYLPEVYMNSYTNSNGACIRDEVYIKNGVTQAAVPRLVTGTGYNLLPRNDYNELMTAIATVGPLAVNVDASTWHMYESGVFTGCPQTDVDINHVVQLVGYGTDTVNGDYWLVRNSWTPEYGELGYIRVARENGYCGVDYHNGDGVGCNYDPVNVTVCGMCGIMYDASYPTGASLA